MLKDLVKIPVAQTESHVFSFLDWICVKVYCTGAREGRRKTSSAGSSSNCELGPNNLYHVVTGMKIDFQNNRIVSFVYGIMNN